MDCGFSFSLMQERRATRLAEKSDRPCPTVPMDERSSQPKMMTGDNPIVDCYEIPTQDQESRAKRVDPEQNHQEHEINQSQSGKRAQVATVQYNQNGAR